MKLKINDLRQAFSNSDDVIFYERSFGTRRVVTFIYCSSTCDEKYFNESVLPELARSFSLIKMASKESMIKETAIKIKELEKITQQEISGHIFAGRVVLWMPHLNTGFFLNAKKANERDITDGSIEVSIRGPRDALIEDIHTNVALIRKRLPSESLAYNTYTIGTKTQTKVGLLYDSQRISPVTLEDIRTKLTKVQDQIEEVISATQLEEAISDNPYSLFPLTAYTGRADFITSFLIKGRFVILIDGIPGAVIAPATLPLLLKTAEDAHFNYISTTFGRILRYFSLGVAIFLPSFYIALTGFHQDQIPFPLLSTISLTRLGIPFALPLEALLMLGLIEIFREAGFRLPSPIGQSITVVGGLIIGDAAIRAGLTSPTMVVVVAIAIVASSTLISQTLSGTVSVLRFVTLLFSSILGMFGFMLSFILIIVYLSTLTSFGTAYLAPISPLYLKDVIRAVVLLPVKWMGHKPSYLKKK